MIVGAGIENHVLRQNPFWVVSTTGDLMGGHNDIFNQRFQSFISQMYLGVIAVRMRQPEEPPQSASAERVIASILGTEYFRAWTRVPSPPNELFLVGF